MQKFNIYNKVDKIELCTTFGILSINNIYIDPRKFEEYICEIVLEKSNLEFIFMTKINNQNDLNKILQRFIPREEENELESFLEKEMTKKSFYSFLAEGLLSLVLKDIYNYKLSSASIDINATLIDTKSGTDVCMYDTENNIFILGEAKFYKNLMEGFGAIVNNFTKKDGFRNKLESLLRSSENNDESVILIRKLNSSKIKPLSLRNFLKFNIKFAGFVLHQHSGKIAKYLSENFYDNVNISSDLINSNLSTIFKDDIYKQNEIIFLHLPISNKKDFIKKIIKEVMNKIGD